MVEGFQHPAYWRAGTGAHKNLWTCSACKDARWKTAYEAIRHEKTSAHSDTVAFLQQQTDLTTPHPSLVHERALTVAAPLTQVCRELSQAARPPSQLNLQHQSHSATPGHRDTPIFSLGGNLNTPHDQDAIAGLAQSLAEWLDDPSQAPSEPLSNAPPPFLDAYIPHHGLYTGAPPMRKTRDSAVNPAWFPWPNKVVCVLDILRNLPRSLLSDTQMEIITWGMMNLGIDDLPSISSLKDTFGGLQQRYGIRTTRREGALGHVYYTNSLADQICQEFSNPRVVSHLCAYPEDAGNKLEQAWQADRWLKEIEPALTTPMIRAHGHDFYIFEPTKLNDGRIVLPTRWFFRTKHENGKAVRHFFGQACKLEPVVTDQGPSGYIAVEHETLEIDARDLLFPFPRLVDTFHLDHLPDPRVMLGTVKEAGQGVLPWTHTQDPSLGNDWRVKSKGHRVEAMMMWLYCDDTSGNLSKKWNKHNSFLWTPAGLPRDMAQKQYNVHFLATSNIAPPLEMLDGVAADLEAAQRDGIWAWDVAAQELVLVFPIVLALLGDNPMQSEFACHIGLRGKFFCRACWVKGRDADDENGTVPQRTIIPDMVVEDGQSRRYTSSIGESSCDVNSQDGVTLEVALSAGHNTKTTSNAGGAGASI